MATPADDEFDAFVRETSGRMLAAARLIIGSNQQAEDLVQEAYARTYAHWPKVRDGQPYAYARRIMLNRHLDAWRRPWREYAHEDPTGAIPQSLPDHSERLADVDQVRRGLALLTRKERAVIVLRYFEGASEAEIAEALGMAPGTVKSTANRAINRLRQSPHFAHLWEGSAR